MNKHTSGPWVFDQEADEVTTPDRIKSNKCCIAIVETGWIEPFESEQQANARLIAAAPDLLEALQMLVDDAHPMLYQHRKAIARAAIAKATGG